jgi:poly-gamma-glutamate capsule biosynthesis protein CapA/YwtB (metallophosphatase superfamily)
VAPLGTLAIAGDVMLGRLVNDAILARGFAYPWGDVLPVLRQADLFLVNLECTLTRHREPWRGEEPKPFYFRADPAVVETLKFGGVDFVSVANNHAGDFGAAGLLETLQVLDCAGIMHAGAGEHLEAARRPAYLTCHGWRLAVVAFADYPAVWAATPASPGINHTPISLAPERFSHVESAVAAARRQADLVIFSIHWGPNLCARPAETFRAFARRVVEAGADIFWGHSAHVVQGIEVWRGKPILYDTGDLVDDYAVDEELRNDLSALFLVRVKPPAIEAVDLVPVRIDRMQANLARGADRDWIAQRLATLCAEMHTQLVPGHQNLSVSITA